ncbi:MAG: DUF1905 domain-containing protein [Leptospirales bacterium]|nr:DUF1905 domain-containing protein [Leptospirales bacterium]
MHVTFEFDSAVIPYAGMGAWHFASLPKSRTAQIRAQMIQRPKAFGSIRVEAKIGKTVWKTSIFPDTKSGTYLLPVKADVRKKESIRMQKVKIQLKLIES